MRAAHAPRGLLDGLGARARGTGPTVRALALLAAACPEADLGGARRPAARRAGPPAPRAARGDARPSPRERRPLPRLRRAAGPRPRHPGPARRRRRRAPARAGAAAGRPDAPLPAPQQPRSAGRRALRGRRGGPAAARRALRGGGAARGGPVAAGDLTEADVAALAAALAEADPGAELLLDLRCPACGERLAGAPRRRRPSSGPRWRSRPAGCCGEVHVLARAYGWREADVLALSPRRRRLYLEMVGA